MKGIIAGSNTSKCENNKDMIIHTNMALVQMLLATGVLDQ